MNLQVKKLRNSARMAAMFICLVTLCACSHSNAPPPNPVSQPQPGAAYGPQPTPGAGPVTPGAKYFEFNDVPFPSAMNVQSKSSYVFQSGLTKVGFFTLRGRVDSNSLVNYFAGALPREGWKLKGQFRYGRALLIFDKPDKVCAILIKEATYYTYVEIYVSPVTGG